MKINVGSPIGTLCWEYFQYDQVSEVCKCIITVVLIIIQTRLKLGLKIMEAVTKTRTKIQRF